MITHEILGDDMQAVVPHAARPGERCEEQPFPAEEAGLDASDRLDVVVHAVVERHEALQTLPFSRLAERIHNAYRTDKEDVKRDFGGALGAIGDLIGGE
jgi:hypothetical protein